VSDCASSWRVLGAAHFLRAFAHCLKMMLSSRIRFRDPVMLIETDASGERKVGIDADKHPSRLPVGDMEVVLNDSPVSRCEFPRRGGTTHAAPGARLTSVSGPASFCEIDARIELQSASPGMLEAARDGTCYLARRPARDCLGEIVAAPEPCAVWPAWLAGRICAAAALAVTSGSVDVDDD
jgi:hypothetical protein